MRSLGIIYRRYKSKWKKRNVKTNTKSNNIDDNSGRIETMSWSQRIFFLWPSTHIHTQIFEQKRINSRWHSRAAHNVSLLKRICFKMYSLDTARNASLTIWIYRLEWNIQRNRTNRKHTEGSCSKDFIIQLRAVNIVPERRKKQRSSKMSLKKRSRRRISMWEANNFSNVKNDSCQWLCWLAVTI